MDGHHLRRDRRAYSADGIWSHPVGLTECGPFRGVVCILSQTRQGRAAPGMLMELLFSAPFLWGYLIWLGERGRAFPRRRRIHGSAAHRLRIRLAIPQLGLSLGIPQCADDLAEHHAIPLADYGFLLGAFVMREPISASKLLVFCSSG